MRRTLSTLTGWLVPVGVLGLLVLAAGCSSSGTITGKITYQGRPVTGGTVLFASADGKGNVSSQIGADGSYTINKMPAGLAKIAVETKSAQPTQSRFGVGPPKGMQPPPGTVPEGAKSVYDSGSATAKAELLPDTYGNPESSGLTFEVKGGAQTHNIELK
jgi:hypothetical protein